MKIDAVTDALREAILDGRLAGDTRLVEAELVAEHDAARHTVRAALRTLADEGLVAIEPHRGARVSGLDADAIVALYELRTALEVEGAHLALVRHDGRLPSAVHEAADALARACRVTRPRWPVVSRAHAELHSAIVRGARSPRILAAHDRLSAETRPFLLRIRPQLTFEELAAQHLELVHALETEGAGMLRGHLRAWAAMLVDELPPAQR